MIDALIEPTLNGRKKSIGIKRDGGAERRHRLLIQMIGVSIALPFESIDRIYVPFDNSFPGFKTSMDLPT